MTQNVIADKTTFTALTGDLSLRVSTRPSPGVGVIGFALASGTEAHGPVTWVYVTNFCAALAGGLALNIIGQGGASLGDPFGPTRRRGVTQETDGAFTITTLDGTAGQLALRPIVAPPTVRTSVRGNPVIYPVNTRVTLELDVDGQTASIDPQTLIDILTDHGVILRCTDTQRMMTRHLEEAVAPFEVWPTGWMVRVSVLTRSE